MIDYATAILNGLQPRRGRTDRPRKHVYAGTVPDAVIADRRRKNRAARKSRRVNRRK